MMKMNAKTAMRMETMMETKTRNQYEIQETELETGVRVGSEATQGINAEGPTSRMSSSAGVCVDGDCACHACGGSSAPGQDRGGRDRRDGRHRHA